MSPGYFKGWLGIFISVTDCYSFQEKIKTEKDTKTEKKKNSNFSCMFLNPNNLFPIWILIVLIDHIWETSRNKLKKHSATKIVLSFHCLNNFFLIVGHNNFGKKILIFPNFLGKNFGCRPQCNRKCPLGRKWSGLHRVIQNWQYNWKIAERLSCASEQFWKTREIVDCKNKH